MKVRKVLADLSPADQVKLRALLPLGTTLSTIMTIENDNPTEDYTGAPVKHHASVSFLMARGFSWQNAVQLATSLC